MLLIAQRLSSWQLVFVDPFVIVLSKALHGVQAERVIYSV